MAIHLYLDVALTQPLSEGDGAQPDADQYNGTDGEAKDRQIWVANEQTRLADSMSALQSTLVLEEPRFSDGEIIIAGSEQMQVLAGGGSDTLTVSRGYADTVPATHEAGVTVYSGYQYTGLVVEPIDEDGSDESHWYSLAIAQSWLDSALPGATVHLGDKSHDQVLTFWRRCAVPPGTPVQNKRDIKLRLTGIEAPIL